MLWWYRRVHQLVMILLPLLYWVTPKLKKGYLLRQKQNGRSPWLEYKAPKSPYWFHCSSGEYEYALPLIRLIKSKNPDQPIIVTYFTPSYLPRLSKDPWIDAYMPSPWDTPQHLQEFLKHHQPKALLIARTDFWPEMLEQCQLQDIPRFVFSMTFNKKLGGLGKHFILEQLRKISGFFLVNDADKAALEEHLPLAETFVMGDTRYEQCLFRLSQKQPLKISKPNAPLFLCGSTWPEDEKALLPALSELQARMSLILVPHEISEGHLSQLESNLKSKGLRPQRYSQVSEQTPWNPTSLLIVDEFGLLAHLYSLADVTFVGGSFKKQVHSVMESLACGCLTLVGPHHSNNREALTFKTWPKERRSAVRVLTGDPNSFAGQIIEGFQTWSPEDRLLLKGEFQSHAGASQQIYRLLEPLVRSSKSSL